MISQIIRHRPTIGTQAGQYLASSYAGIVGRGKGYGVPLIRPVVAVLAPRGTDEVGSGSATSLRIGGISIIRGFKLFYSRTPMRAITRVAATGTFNLNYLTTPDNGTTVIVGKQVPSTTRAVDGGTSGFTEVAELDLAVGYLYKLEICNTSGIEINYAFEFREYGDAG